MADFGDHGWSSGSGVGVGIGRFVVMMGFECSSELKARSFSSGLVEHP
ncbi:hypothetical protein HMPREF9440_01785 [Sutterella parvirubra YIT 11816]|uniref:Uncharacterized protein n=1 Tax=Sutterella parvirubra YIT 11816 TaxID=762967 RepID=H3KGA7_9BURK|nr:hypothetical protein HMPREF9440_01785 [Sutterella parvirubra YIT 11816]